MAISRLALAVKGWLHGRRRPRRTDLWDFVDQPGDAVTPGRDADRTDPRNGAPLPGLDLEFPRRFRLETLLDRLDRVRRLRGEHEPGDRSELTRFAGLLTGAGLGGFLEVSREPDLEQAAIDDCLVSLLTTTGFEAEQYRVLRHGIETMGRESDLRIVAVTSPGVGDGKTVTAINLAGALAQSATARVLLVDLDVRRSPLARRLGLRAPRRGLVDLLLNANLALEETIVEMPRFNLWVLPAGTRAPAPYEALQSPRLETLLTEVRQRYTYVVVDTAPFLPVPDTRLLAQYVDGFLVVISAHQTPRGSLAEALNLMEPSKIVGLVLNGNDAPPRAYYEMYSGAPGAGRPA